MGSDGVDGAQSEVIAAMFRKYRGKVHLWLCALSCRHSVRVVVSM